MSLKNIKKDLFKDHKMKKRYFDDSDIYFAVSENVLNARLKAGLTQEGLAKKLNTKQSSISRLERGRELPSLSFLLKIAQVLNMKISAPSFYSFSENKQSIK